MPLYADVRALVEETVVGVKAEDGTVDARMSSACREGYERSLFFCPLLADIKGLAQQIREKARSFHDADNVVSPGSMSLMQVQEGQEALSLNALITIQQAMKAICDNTDRYPAMASLAETIRRHFKHENILPPNSIIPSFFAPDPEILKSLREAHAPPGMDRSAFSSVLMKGTFGDKLAERMFLTRLEEGFDSAHPNNGWFKLTERTARLLHERLGEFAGDDLPEFEMFAPPAPAYGPRRGQISKGLRVSWGNLV